MADCVSAVALIGSNGVKPRLAANLGTFGFHLGPNSCENVRSFTEFDLPYCQGKVSPTMLRESIPKEFSNMLLLELFAHWYVKAFVSSTFFIHRQTLSAWPISDWIAISQRVPSIANIVAMMSSILLAACGNCQITYE